MVYRRSETIQKHWHSGQLKVLTRIGASYASKKQLQLGILWYEPLGPLGSAIGKWQEAWTSQFHQERSLPKTSHHWHFIIHYCPCHCPCNFHRHSNHHRISRGWWRPNWAFDQLSRPATACNWSTIINLIICIIIIIIVINILIILEYLQTSNCCLCYL